LVKLKVFLIGTIFALLALSAAVPLPAVQAADDPPPTPTPESTTTSVEVINDYYSIIHTTTRDGLSLQADVISGPPEPPDKAAWEASRVDVKPLDRASMILAGFPSFSWVFGCSAVSGAMIAAYYDNNGYGNLYTGQANGGVMPLTDTSWPTWTDSINDRYPNNPLIASHQGVDGQVGRGSIDDYWVSYGSQNDDPYITNSWSQHTWGTAIGDYMKTSQSAYGNVDGGTSFYSYLSGSDPLTCSAMEGGPAESKDGTYGRKEFYEARGYTVTDCYNQPTNNAVAGGFSLAQFQAEINAGNPVLINLQGHSIVGYGYNDSTIYIRDTWDNDPNNIYTMPWGGSYQGMQMLSVSIVHLEDIPHAPAAFDKTSPSNGAVNQSSSPTLRWQGSTYATGYEYCYSTSPSCSTWQSAGTNTWVSLPQLASDTTYYWQVRASNSEGTVYANGASDATWSFRTLDPAILIESIFVPMIVN
jgi:hypothetical protein